MCLFSLFYHAYIARNLQVMRIWQFAAALKREICLDWVDTGPSVRSLVIFLPEE